MADPAAHSPLVQGVLDSLSDTLVRHLESMLREAETDKERIHRDIDGYLLWLDGGGLAERETLEVARALARRCHALVDRFGSGHDDAQRLAQVAARYFVTDQDASPDTSGPAGFVDDAAVVDAVEKALAGR